jgi:hypothetical protein
MKTKRREEEPWVKRMKDESYEGTWKGAPATSIPPFFVFVFAHRACLRSRQVHLYLSSSAITIRVLLAS